MPYNLDMFICGILKVYCFFNKYLLNIYYVADSALDTEDIALKDQKCFLFSWGLQLGRGKTLTNKHIEIRNYSQDEDYDGHQTLHLGITFTFFFSFDL